MFDQDGRLEQKSECGFRSRMRSAKWVAGCVENTAIKKAPGVDRGHCARTKLELPSGKRILE